MMPVKLGIFVVAAMATYPAGLWLRSRPTLQAHLWTLVGFLPFYSSLDMALVSFGDRPGDTHGFEVALIDWFVLSLLFASRARVRRPPYRIALGAYLLVAIIAAAQAQWMPGAFGYVWKICRMYLVFATIWHCARDIRVPAALLRGMMFGILYEAALTTWQHFVLQVHQASGSFAHQNTLGILVNLVVMVPIALILAGNATTLAWLAVAAAVPTTIFTVSRGTILFLGVGNLLVYAGSVLRRFDVRKAKLGLLGALFVAVAVPVALVTLQSRSADEQAGSMRLRGNYEEAAAMMLRDHPLGVGPNQFTVMLLTGGYGDRAGVDWTQRIAIVHNIYWLTAAEMGYAGLAVLVLLFSLPVMSAFRWSFRARHDRRGDILLGLGVGLTVFYAHSLFEWVWRDTAVSYVYWMVVGMVAALAGQLHAETASSKTAKPLTSMAPREGRHRTGAVVVKP